MLQTGCYEYLRKTSEMNNFYHSKGAKGLFQWCCVTELEVPSSGTSSNFDGTVTELVPIEGEHTGTELEVPVPLYLQ